MKIIFYSCKLVTACLFIFSIFTSCSHSITIVSGDKTSGDLVMHDSIGNLADIFRVDPGQKIDWKIKKSKNSVVASIEEIAQKITKDSAYINVNVFDKQPHKKLLSKTWKGVIEKAKKNKSDNPDVEIYYIKWKDKQGVSHIYDPKIQVNSK